MDEQHFGPFAEGTCVLVARRQIEQEATPLGAVGSEEHRADLVFPFPEDAVLVPVVPVRDEREAKGQVGRQLREELLGARLGLSEDAAKYLLARARRAFRDAFAALRLEPEPALVGRPTPALREVRDVS